MTDLDGGEPQPRRSRFGDYWRLGLPLEILVVMVSVPMLLMVWPL